MFLRKGVLIICSKFTGEHPCRIVISIKLLRYKVSIKLQSNFIEIALRYGCSPVNLLHTFRTNFSRNISRWLLLKKDFFVIFWSSFLEHTYRSAISIKLLYNVIEIALRHGCSPVNLLCIFRRSFSKDTSGWLLLYLTLKTTTLS